MNCPKCGTDVGSAKYCPNCGAPIDPSVAQQTNASAQPPKKKGGPLKIVLIVLGVLVVIGIIGSIFGEGEDTSSSSSSASELISSEDDSTEVSQEAPVSSEALENKVYGVNETAQYNDVELSVTKVEKSSGSTYDKPKDGMEYIIVTVQYKNNSTDENISYNPYDFKIKNSQGQITDITFTTINTDTALSSGELAPGGTISGTLAFEEPINDPELILQYTGSIFSSDADIEFKLN